MYQKLTVMHKNDNLFTKNKYTLILNDIIIYIVYSVLWWLECSKTFYSKKIVDFKYSNLFYILY